MIKLSELFPIQPLITIKRLSIYVTMEEIPGEGAWISTLTSVHISSLKIGSIDFKPSLLELRRLNVTETELVSEIFSAFFLYALKALPLVS